MKTIDLSGTAPGAAFELSQDAYIHCVFLIRGCSYGSVTLIWRDRGEWHCRTQTWFEGRPHLDAHQHSSHPDACPFQKADEMRKALGQVCRMFDDELVEILVEGPPEKMARLVTERTDEAARFVMLKREELGNDGGQVN